MMTPAQKLGLLPEDTQQADEIEKMLGEAFGEDIYDNAGELVMLLLILVAQLRRRVDALEGLMREDRRLP
jgi:hypothetical protein